MIQFLGDHLEAILSFIAGLLSGGFITYKYSNSTKILGVNTGGGDFAGHNMTKKR